jgi:hypothetical protein
MVRKFSKKPVTPVSWLTCSSRGLAASNPADAMNPGRSRSAAAIRPPPAVIPAWANERKMMSARVEKLPMISANAPT